MMCALRFVSAPPSSRHACMWLLLALLTLFALVFSEAVLAQNVQGDNRQMLAPPGDPEEPYNSGYMVSQSVPQTMLVNGLYNVSVTMANTGSLLWYRSNQYRLGAVAPHDNWTWGLNRVELPAEIIASGGTAQFNFQIRAPSTPGTYTFQWGMLQEGVEWFGAPTTPVSITVREPINNASYVSHYQTTQMQTGQRYDVSVTLHNNGETTWSRGLQYTLMAQAPHNNTTWGLNRVPLPVEEVRPGESVTFTFPVTAPASAGSYLSQWGMQREGHGSFGASTAAVAVNVVAPPPLVNNAQVVATNVPAFMQSGKSYDIAVTVQNTGTTTWSEGTLHRLGSVNPYDNQTWGVGRVGLATPVGPGQQYTFSFPVTAPAAGSYAMQWRMVQDAVEWFGGISSNAVEVGQAVIGDVTYIHTDGLGSPVARTNATGAVISRTRYEPYGYVAAGATPTIGFTGHVNDADIGLTYMQQRYYDPVAGRFLSVDPVVTDANTGGSFSRYAYADNSPYKYIDPDGRSPVDVGFLVVDAVKFGTAVYSGTGIGAAAADLAMSAVGVASPIPGTGQFFKGIRTAANIIDLGKGAKAAAGAVDVAAKSATQIAQAGGRHAGQLAQFAKQTPDQLGKTINSFDKQIAKHEGFIANPTSHVPNFNELSTKHQGNLIHHWGQDIKRHQELKSIAEDVLKGL